MSTSHPNSTDCVISLVNLGDAVDSLPGFQQGFSKDFYEIIVE